MKNDNAASFLSFRAPQLREESAPMQHRGSLVPIPFYTSVILSEARLREAMECESKDLRMIGYVCSV